MSGDPPFPKVSDCHSLPMFPHSGSAGCFLRNGRLRTLGTVESFLKNFLGKAICKAGFSLFPAKLPGPFLRPRESFVPRDSPPSMNPFFFLKVNLSKKAPPSCEIGSSFLFDRIPPTCRSHPFSSPPVTHNATPSPSKNHFFPTYLFSERAFPA